MHISVLAAGRQDGEIEKIRSPNPELIGDQEQAGERWHRLTVLDPGQKGTAQGTGRGALREPGRHPMEPDLGAERHGEGRPRPYARAFSNS